MALQQLMEDYWTDPHVSRKYLCVGSVVHMLAAKVVAWGSGVVAHASPGVSMHASPSGVGPSGGTSGGC